MQINSSADVMIVLDKARTYIDNLTVDSQKHHCSACGKQLNHGTITHREDCPTIIRIKEIGLALDFLGGYKQDPAPDQNGDQFVYLGAPELQGMSDENLAVHLAELYYTCKFSEMASWAVGNDAGKEFNKTSAKETLDTLRALIVRLEKGKTIACPDTK